MIKVTKKQLAQALKSAVLTKGELDTLFSDVMFIVNSRPLMKGAGDDPLSCNPITPLHLMGGRSTINIPDPTFDGNANLTKRLRFIEEMKKDFWKKWLSWETKVENKKAVFNYLMGLETSLDFLYDPDYKPQTQYHKEVIRKCLPLEVKWLDKFITEEFPKECYTENDGAETDTREVVVSTNFLRNNFIADHSFTNQISSCAFGIKLKDLVMKDGLPFDNKCEAGKPLRTKIQNIAAWRFKRKDVYDWLVEKDYTDFKIEGHSLPPPVGCVENSGFKK